MINREMRVDGSRTVLKELLQVYGLAHVADLRIMGNTFSIEVADEAATEREGSIYAFVVDEEIVRIGSSAGPLKKRLAAWVRDVSTALAGGKSATPHDEAERWRLALAGDVVGAVYARQAATVTTPVGTFRAHLDEERVLIARHRPRLNRSGR